MAAVAAPSLAAAPAPAVQHHGDVPILAVTRGVGGARGAESAGRVEIFSQYGDNKIAYRDDQRRGETTRAACKAVEPLLDQLQKGSVTQFSVNATDDYSSFMGSQVDSLEGVGPDGSEIHFSSSRSPALINWVNALFTAVAACI